MFRRVAQSIRSGRSPLLFTGVEGELLGRIALCDGDRFWGDPALSGIDAGGKLPRIESGVLIERIVTAPELILCGGGHVSVQVAKVAKLCGFSITVIDDRAEFANAERFPDADRIVNLPFGEALSQIETPNGYYVIVTRGHQNDRACLETVLNRPFAYCGMIGSHTKVSLLFAHLMENGYTSERIARVHAPIGLSIGAVTPEEIAVSIVGELIEVKNAGLSGVVWDEALLHGVETLREPYAMVTLIAKKGSAPRSTGARMIVQRDGTILSSIGGGFGEYEAAQYALAMLRDGTAAKRYTCSMTNDDAAKAGMVCGGTVDVLIQIVKEETGWKT